MNSRVLPENPRETKERPSLLLHSCCAPCSSHVMESLCDHFKLTVFYYNPNIYPEAEYEKRKSEQIRLIGEYNKTGRDIDFIDADYDPDRFDEMSKGLENEREGGSRCFGCFQLRLRKTAEWAKRNGCDFFATTLTVSPHKNAAIINQIGEQIETETSVKFLVADFKKKNGYKRSIELSREYDLYRQTYCGCIFSMKRSPE